MSGPLAELEGTWSEIAAQIPDFAGRKLHVIVLPAKETPAPAKKDSRSIAELLADIAAQTDPKEEANLPADFTSQLDHYVYGTPKI